MSRRAIPALERAFEAYQQLDDSERELFVSYCKGYEHAMQMHNVAAGIPHGHPVPQPKRGPGRPKKANSMDLSTTLRTAAQDEGL